MIGVAFSHESMGSFGVIDSSERLTKEVQRQLRTKKAYPETTKALPRVHVWTACGTHRVSEPTTSYTQNLAM